MLELDGEESWAPKNWCFWTVVLEKTLESPLDCKEIQPVHPKGNQSWMFIGRTDVEAETPVLWPPHAKSWLIGKDPDAGRDWGQEEKEMMEDEMAGWHHRLDGCESEWTPGVGDGQGGLACCDSWGGKESDTGERLNWTDSGELGNPERSSSAGQGRVPAPPQGRCIILWDISLSSSAGSRASTPGWRWELQAGLKQWTPDWLEPEDWWLRFPEHQPVSLHQPTRGGLNQRTGSSPVPQINFSYKNSSLRKEKEPDTTEQLN